MIKTETGLVLDISRKSSKLLIYKDVKIFFTICNYKNTSK